MTLAWSRAGPGIPSRQGECLCLVDGRIGFGPADGRSPAAAYRERGEGILQLAGGNFALVAWDGERGQGLLAADQLASRPLFLAESGGRLFFASEVRDLIRMLPRTPEPDGVAAVRWLANGSLAPGQTLYRGVRRLTGGEFVRLARDAWTAGRYWMPVYHSAGRSRAEAVADLRAALCRAISIRMAEAGPTGILLSGGIDSVSVAALAQLDARARGTTLRAYSALFPGEPTVDESLQIEAVRAHLGLEGTSVQASTASMLRPALEYLAEWRLPSPSPNLVFQLPLLRRAGGEGTAVLLDGQGGDELFGPAPYLLADRVRHGRVLDSLRLARRLPGLGDPPNARAVRRLWREFGVKGAAPELAHALVRKLRGPEHYAAAWLTPASARMALETSAAWTWKRDAGPLWWGQLADQLTRQRERMGAHDFLRRRNALAGVKGGHPLLDDLDLIELVLSVPPEFAFDPRFDRPLLREIVQDLLPDSVRLRAEKSYFNAFFRACLEGPDFRLLVRLLGDAGARVGAYARLEVVQERLLEAPPRHRGGAWAWALWRLAGLELWLREQEQAGAAARDLDELHDVGSLSRAGDRARSAPGTRS